MTDHLPECPLLEPCDDEVADHGYCSMQHGVFCIHCQQWCICDRLRACEQRVNSSNLTMWNRTQQQAQHMIDSGLGIAWKDGFKEGLDAAREAVAAMEIGSRFSADVQADALAAIDALREKP